MSAIAPAGYGCRERGGVMTQLRRTRPATAPGGVHPENEAAFEAFHRSRRSRLVGVSVRAAVVCSLVVAAVWGVAASSIPLPAAGAAATPATALAGQPAAAVLADAAPPTAQPVAPSSDPTTAPPPPIVENPAPVILAPVSTYSIAVTARGYQAELDACQWVRMDIGAVAPIVGAHNYCHGDQVLAMQVGEIVTVTGADLDGDYQIIGSRDAHAGDSAADATVGMGGDLLFQTCYYDKSRGLRLVSAVRVDLSLPPVLRG